jgi:hypothetical protein
MVPIKIYTVYDWNARKPRSKIQTCPAASRVIFHHTAGHHREISGPKTESLQEAMQYARDIQKYHMDSNGWIDSGHNFLVCHNGDILQGRWQSVSSIQQGRMVVSAHCPGQNTQIGIEHEHYGAEPMTKAQRDSSARLIAWCSDQYHRKTPLPIEPHSKYYATACPANLKSEIPTIFKMATSILRGL